MIEINFTQKAAKQIKKLDKEIQKQIKKWKEEMQSLENPNQRGKALKGSLKGLWRYRINDYRLICLNDNEKLTILCLEIGHRKDIYKQ
ncbi:type II toxin-antitoxin system RelE/ParE family toxin [Campylobacter sp. 2018MI35]|uniref:type II toxin-antitoxin system RelE family toxin n=1 Tax=Campylobacter molothri TaxID=1032242 RepID=UPI001904165D|nr:type II toxin-antitoxin system RelE/ParE family toxin [Campylobacter sp. 2018MI35]MBK1999968.1 type II toxin-antitoxin system RelE/ParE family toxin [Campylobacter sp. 2018MI35]